MIRLTVKWDIGRGFESWCTTKMRGLRSWGRGEIQAAPAMLAAVEQYHADLFASGGQAVRGTRAGYPPWSRLSRRTLRARARNTRVSRIAPGDYSGPGQGGLLHWSGRLYRSLATQGNTYGDAIRVSRPTGITFGTKTPTALFHAAGRKNMPIRMPLDDRVAPEVAIDVAFDKIMGFLFADSASGGALGARIVRNAAGFYSRM